MRSRERTRGIDLERERKWRELWEQGRKLAHETFTDDEGRRFFSIYKPVFTELITVESLPPGLRELWDRAEQSGLLDILDATCALIHSPAEAAEFFRRYEQYRANPN